MSFAYCQKITAVAYPVAFLSHFLVILVLIEPGYGATSLRLGSTGSEVQDLQIFLRQCGLYSGNIDQIYGVSMENAVKSFQKFNGLDIDGIAGSDTQSIIRRKSFVGCQPPTNQSPSPSSSNENILLGVTVITLTLLIARSSSTKTLYGEFSGFDLGTMLEFNLYQDDQLIHVWKKKCSKGKEYHIPKNINLSGKNYYVIVRGTAKGIPVEKKAQLS